MLNDQGRLIQSEFRGNEAVCAQLIGLFQLISNKARFRIICTLSRGDFCVNDIAEIIGETKVSNISQHLKMLRLAGIIESRREENRVIYHLSDARMPGMIQFFRTEFLDPSPESQSI